MTDQNGWDRLTGLLRRSLLRIQEDRPVQDVDEWDSDENVDSEVIPQTAEGEQISFVGSGISDVRISSNSLLLNGGGDYLSWDDGYVSVTSDGTLLTNDITLSPNPGQEIRLVAGHNEPVSILVDREQYDIELLDDRIEIRRKFDNESNDNGTHPVAPEHSLQRSENVLLRYTTE